MSETPTPPRRATIKDIARATGYSRATVDRALNGRGRVHPRTEQLIQAARESLVENPVAPFDVGVLAGSPMAAERPVELLFQVGRGMTDQLRGVCAASDRPIDVFDFYQRDNEAVSKALERLCADTAHPLVAIVKNEARNARIMAAARQRGKRIVTMVSDVDAHARDAFVGIDDRMAGRTAAFLIGNLLRGQDARVGAVLGSSSFRCQEDREIGFRTHLRGAFPNLTVCDAVQGDDSPDKTFQAVRDLLRTEPDLAAIYNGAGGNVGLAEAVREAGRAGDIFVIAHETNDTTVPLAEDGLIHFLIGQDTGTMLARALDLAAAPEIQADDVVSLVDFFVFTQFNIGSAAIA